jgi:hypothetical protein
MLHVWERRHTHKTFWLGKLREGGYYEDLAIEGMVTLEETVYKCDWRALTGCIFLKWRGFLNKALNHLFP